MATIRTEDAQDRLHLSLLSSPKDHDNPNTGEYTYNEEALGQGTWIVIINTGYNWEQFPEVSPRTDPGIVPADTPMWTGVEMASCCVAARGQPKEKQQEWGLTDPGTILGIWQAW